MNARLWFRLVGLLFVLVLAAGCDKAPPPPPPKVETGAEQVAKTFFDALSREDWEAAYGTLDPDGKAWCSREQFATLGKEYVKQIGFTPTDVDVSVTETSDRATAIAVFRGVSGTSTRQHKDGTPLRRTAGGWAVVLRKNFGKEAPAAKAGKG